MILVANRAPPEVRVGLRMFFSARKTQVGARTFPDRQSLNFANDSDDGCCGDQDHARVMGIVNGGAGLGGAVSPLLFSWSAV